MTCTTDLPEYPGAYRLHFIYDDQSQNWSLLAFWNGKNWIHKPTRAILDLSKYTWSWSATISEEENDDRSDEGGKKG